MCDNSSIWLVTFLSVIILDIDYGLYIGLIWSLITLIYKSQRPRNYLLGTVGDQTDVFVPIGKYVSAKEVPGIKIYQFCGPLHFANVDYFTEGLEQKIGFSPKEIKRKLAKLEKIKNSNKINCNKNITEHRNRLSYNNKRDTIPKLPTHLIIDCSMFSYIDTNGIKTLKRMIADYGAVGLKTLLGGCPSHVTKQLERDHFYAAVPAHHIYISIYDAIQCAIQQQRDGISMVAKELQRMDDEINGKLNGTVLSNGNGIHNIGYENFDEIRIELEPGVEQRVSPEGRERETAFNID
ncbi:unnamed protein product [Oppiella nova]|uniref:STAS domain-containing protein n=1 Tax=Oppiella nova TaxID=334625 RepID=A0A7R9LP86_9ACAR|nr:unnamed protein product [Oppiella nova]CAG2164978.1 unnamed protein product [Oppiella nova]